MKKNILAILVIIFLVSDVLIFLIKPEFIIHPLGALYIYGNLMYSGFITGKTIAKEFFL